MQATAKDRRAARARARQAKRAKRDRILGYVSYGLFGVVIGLSHLLIYALYERGYFDRLAAWIMEGR